jgi:hypothetical protein
MRNNSHTSDAAEAAEPSSTPMLEPDQLLGRFGMSATTATG